MNYFSDFWNRKGLFFSLPAIAFPPLPSKLLLKSSPRITTEWIFWLYCLHITSFLSFPLFYPIQEICVQLKQCYQLPIGSYAVFTGSSTIKQGSRIKWKKMLISLNILYSVPGTPLGTLQILTHLIPRNNTKQEVSILSPFFRWGKQGFASKSSLAQDHTASEWKSQDSYPYIPTLITLIAALLYSIPMRKALQAVTLTAVLKFAKLSASLSIIPIVREEEVTDHLWPLPGIDW